MQDDLRAKANVLDRRANYLEMRMKDPQKNEHRALYDLPEIDALRAGARSLVVAYKYETLRNALRSLVTAVEEELVYDDIADVKNAVEAALRALAETRE